MIANSLETNAKVFEPGATIGILGSGQLGRMMAIAAKQMGYRVHIFSPTHDSPAGQVADLEIQASFDNLAVVERFAQRVDVITLETENIPMETVLVASQSAPVYPGLKALEFCQNRRKEKMFLADYGIPTCQFEIVRSLVELKSVCRYMMPAIVKTTTGGYDGKGQFLIQTPDQIEEAWHTLNANELIVEEFVEFDYEFSVIGARSSAGVFAAYPSIRNEHRDHILNLSFSPSGLSDQLNQRATEIVYEIMNEMDAVGVMAVEFFYRDGEILVNEMAPRPHNSGHLTIEAHVTSQFEQHIRAVCGLMLGITRQTIPAASANILGLEWNQSKSPTWQLGLSMPCVKLHLYGKESPEEKRKMGHMTALAQSAEKAKQYVVAARRLLNIPAMSLNANGTS